MNFNQSKYWQNMSIEEKLGEGSFSKVYKIIDLDTGKVSALKEMKRFNWYDGLNELLPPNLYHVNILLSNNFFVAERPLQLQILERKQEELSLNSDSDVSLDNLSLDKEINDNFEYGPPNREFAYILSDYCDMTLTQFIRMRNDFLTVLSSQIYSQDYSENSNARAELIQKKKSQNIPEINMFETFSNMHVSNEIFEKGYNKKETLQKKRHHLQFNDVETKKTIYDKSGNIIYCHDQKSHSYHNTVSMKNQIHQSMKPCSYQERDFNKSDIKNRHNSRNKVLNQNKNPNSFKKFDIKRTDAKINNISRNKDQNFIDKNREPFYKNAFSSFCTFNGCECGTLPLHPLQMGHFDIFWSEKDLKDITPLKYACLRYSIKFEQNGPKIDRLFCAKIFKNIVEGVLYLHMNHIVHSDLKSNNILLQCLNDNLIPKCCDFGLRKPITNVAIDLKGLGLIYFEMLNTSSTVMELDKAKYNLRSHGILPTNFSTNFDMESKIILRCMETSKKKIKDTKTLYFDMIAIIDTLKTYERQNYKKIPIMGASRIQAKN